jgi:hypothetical protein
MSLRLQDRGRIGIAFSFVLLACSSSTPSDTGGSGGAGNSSGGMASAGTNPGTSGTAPSGSGSNAGGTASAGTSSGGSATAGTTATAGSGGSGGASAGTGGGGGSAGAGSKSKTTFFVTSDTSKTGKLGGLEGADKRCQDLAMKAGLGDHTFHAYLSTAAMNAKDRIGAGPWVNSKGVTLATDIATLHSGTVKGDHTLFIDENGKEINGQWNSSPSKEPTMPNEQVNEHDILTGSKADGTLQADATCMDWTSDAANDKGQVGHSDGMGPGMATTGTYTSWNSAHASGSCAATWMAGGAGRLYCFAVN